MGRRIIWADADGFPAGGDGAFAVAQRVQRRRKIGEIGRAVSVPRNGPADQIRGDFVATHLIGKDAQQMERVGVVGLGRENAAIAGLGILQPSCLLVGHARRQETGNLCVGVLASRGGRIGPFEHRGVGHGDECTVGRGFPLPQKLDSSSAYCRREEADPTKRGAVHDAAPCPSQWRLWVENR
jgi:hypothetical protein